MKKILLAMIHGLLPILGIVLIVSIIALVVYCAECFGVSQYISVVVILLVVAWIISAVMWYKHKSEDEKEIPQSRVQKPYMANQALLVAV